MPGRPAMRPVPYLPAFTSQATETAVLRLDASDASGFARECPRVPSVYDVDKATAPFAGVSSKPSDGLEPSTPSLPWNFSGNRSQPTARLAKPAAVVHQRTLKVNCLGGHAGASTVLHRAVAWYRLSWRHRY